MSNITCMESLSPTIQITSKSNNNTSQTCTQSNTLPPTSNNTTQTKTIPTTTTTTTCTSKNNNTSPTCTQNKNLPTSNNTTTIPPTTTTTTTTTSTSKNNNNTSPTSKNNNNNILSPDTNTISTSNNLTWSNQEYINYELLNAKNILIQKEAKIENSIQKRSIIESLKQQQTIYFENQIKIENNKIFKNVKLCTPIKEKYHNFNKILLISRNCYQIFDMCNLSTKEVFNLEINLELPINAIYQSNTVLTKKDYLFDITQKTYYLFDQKMVTSGIPGTFFLPENALTIYDQDQRIYIFGRYGNEFNNRLYRFNTFNNTLDRSGTLDLKEDGKLEITSLSIHKGIIFIYGFLQTLIEGKKKDLFVVFTYHTITHEIKKIKVRDNVFSPVNRCCYVDKFKKIYIFNQDENGAHFYSISLQELPNSIPNVAIDFPVTQPYDMKLIYDDDDRIYLFPYSTEPNLNFEIFEFNISTENLNRISTTFSITPNTYISLFKN